MKDSLININKYLKIPKVCEKMIVRFAYSVGKSEGLDITLDETLKIYRKIKMINIGEKYLQMVKNT